VALLTSLRGYVPSGSASSGPSSPLASRASLRGWRRRRIGRWSPLPSMAVTLWVADLIAALLLVGAASGSAVQATSATRVVRNLARIAVIIVGTLVLLGTIGVSDGLASALQAAIQ